MLYHTNAPHTPTNMAEKFSFKKEKKEASIDA